MNKKIYKLRNDFKYKGSNNNTFTQYINKRKLEKALSVREGLFKRYKKFKRMNDFALGFLLVVFYYFLVFSMMLLSHFGGL